MEVIFGIIALALTVAMPFMVIVMLVKICCIQREIEAMNISLLKFSLTGKGKQTCGAIVKTDMKAVPSPNTVDEGTPALAESVPEPKHEPVVETVPGPAPMPEPAPVPEPVPMPMPEPVDGPMKPRAVPEAADMGFFDVFWAKFEDWFCVRGDFAPKGTTREFAIATRWLSRVGAVLLVGAIAYFLVLAIDKGWIGPVQRVYGMMAWGVIGTSFGTWLKLRSERYAILGEVCAAVGLVALYLSFGLGHRYFKPPVVASGYVAFAGLFAATIAAGALSVRLRSLMIAGLALVGGFLVPAICSFADHDAQLHIYLFLLSLGAYSVASLRGWPLYSFAAIAVSFMFSQAKCGSCDNCDATAAYMFHALELGLTLAAAIRASVRAENARSRQFRWLYWIPAVLAGIFCICKMDVIVSHHLAWRGAWALNHLGWAMAFAALALLGRRRSWGGTPVFIVFSCTCAVLALATACLDWWHVNDATAILLFCVFAALLAELGARSGERTLQVAAVVATVVMSFVGFGRSGMGADGGGYAQGLVDRIQHLWSVPALVAFVGWRLGERAPWKGWLHMWSFRIAAGMSFVVLTAESHFFGREFLPVLRGGFVTIVWAAVASALLAAGIVRRVKAARLAGLGLLALSVAKLLLADTSSLATPGRVGVFAAVGALLIAGAFLYLKFKPLFEEAGAATRCTDLK